MFGISGTIIIVSEQLKTPNNKFDIEITTPYIPNPIPIGEIPSTINDIIKRAYERL